MLSTLERQQADGNGAQSGIKVRGTLARYVAGNEPVLINREN